MRGDHEDRGRDKALCTRTHIDFRRMTGQKGERRVGGERHSDGYPAILVESLR